MFFILVHSYTLRHTHIFIQDCCIVMYLATYSITNTDCTMSYSVHLFDYSFWSSMDPFQNDPLMRGYYMYILPLSQYNTFLDL